MNTNLYAMIENGTAAVLYLINIETKTAIKTPSLHKMNIWK